MRSQETVTSAGSRTIKALLVALSTGAGPALDRASRTRNWPDKLRASTGLDAGDSPRAAMSKAQKATAAPIRSRLDRNPNAFNAFEISCKRIVRIKCKRKRK